MTDPRIPDAGPETLARQMIERARGIAELAHAGQWYCPGMPYMAHVKLTGMRAWKLAGDDFLTPNEYEFLLKAFPITLPMGKATGKRNVRSWDQLMEGTLADLEAVQRFRQALYRAIGILHDGPEDAHASLGLDVTYMVRRGLPWFVAHGAALLAQRPGQTQDDYMSQLGVTETEVRCGLSERDRKLWARFVSYLGRNHVPMAEYLQELARAVMCVKVADLWVNNSADVKRMVWLPEIMAAAASIIPGAEPFEYVHLSELDPAESLTTFSRMMKLLPGDPWPPKIAEAIRTADRRLENMRAERVMKYRLQMPRLLQVAEDRFGEDSATFQRIAALQRYLAAVKLDEWVPEIAYIIRFEVRDRGLD